jgi:hypothetical protein
MDKIIQPDVPLEYVIGRKYHCTWAKNRGFVWVLMSYDVATDTAYMQTPKTKKPMKTQLSSLREINKNRHSPIRNINWNECDATEVDIY